MLKDLDQWKDHRRFMCLFNSMGVPSGFWAQVPGWQVLLREQSDMREAEDLSSSPPWTIAIAIGQKRALKTS